jgi:Lrp/AsnC family transcriptional regulator for asnA, asnC and gidA
MKDTQKLDLYDKKILYELDIDSRISASNIAKKIKLPKETVNYRIKRLKNSGIVKNYYTIINASRLGYLYYKVFLKFEKFSTKTEKDLIKFILHDKNCINLRIMEGSYDVSFLTTHQNPNKFKAFLYQIIDSFGSTISDKSIHSITTTHKLNQKIFLGGKTINRFFHHQKPKKLDIDEMDKRIIQLLARNARMPLVEISRCIKKSSKVIRYRIKKLENLGVIVGYSYAFDLDRLKRDLIQVDIALKKPAAIPSIIEFFDSTRTCVFAYELLGKYDLSLELYVKDSRDLREILRKFRDTYNDSYTSFDVANVFKEYVIGWSPFDEIIC